MVDVLGHLGMALIWLAPAWFFIDSQRTAAIFVGIGFWFGMLPDIDLLLSNWFPQLIHHHGVVHTVLAVVVFAVVLGPILGWLLNRLFGETNWFSDRAAESAVEMGVIIIAVAGLSHLLADMLSAPDVASPIEPLWPLYDSSTVLVDLFYYKSFWATWGLLIAGLVVNGTLYYWIGQQSTAEDERVSR